MPFARLRRRLPYFCALCPMARSSRRRYSVTMLLSSMADAPFDLKCKVFTPISAVRSGDVTGKRKIFGGSKIFTEVVRF